jgi:hypothetical protein
MNLATLADASSLLLGLDRKNSRVQSEPGSLPLANPIPGQVDQTYGEITRAHRIQVQPDAGWSFASRRFESEFLFAPPPCDPRDSEGVLGSQARMTGRAEMMRRSS